MKVDYRSYFRGLLLFVEERYEEARKIMEDCNRDIREAIGFGFYPDWTGSWFWRQELLQAQAELYYSIEWLQKAAGRGYYQAGCILALCYLIGKGVEKDCRKAISLLAASCVSRDLPSLSDALAFNYVCPLTPDYVLGCIFSSDEFVDPDYMEALKHYERAAREGSFYRDGIYCLLGALRILEGADGASPINISVAENLCADLLVDEVVNSSPQRFKHASHEHSPRNFLLQKLEDYAKIARYKLQGEVLPLARWSQKTGIPQQVLEQRIQRGLPDAEVLRPLDEAEKNKEKEIAVNS